MAEKRRIIYICQDCFTVAERLSQCCGHDMARVDAGMAGDERSKPLVDNHGNLQTRAPIWWVERYAWWISPSHQ
jgi:hypothetical protein